MARTAQGGKGSNQYQTKPGGPATTARAEQTRGLAAAVTVDEDSEAVAWQFHPDRGLWAASGFDRWVLVKPWLDGGDSPEAAAAWLTPDLEVFDAEEATRWRAAGVERHEARGWAQANFRFADRETWAAVGVTYPELAGYWQEAGYQPEQTREWEGRLPPLAFANGKIACCRIREALTAAGIPPFGSRRVTGISANMGSTGPSVRRLPNGLLNWHVDIAGRSAGLDYVEDIPFEEDDDVGFSAVNPESLAPRIRAAFASLGLTVTDHPDELSGQVTPCVTTWSSYDDEIGFNIVTENYR